MRNLDENERTLLGDSFLHLAQAVGAFRIENYHRLTPKMQRLIRTYHKNLIDYADTFYETATTFVVEDAATSIASIQQIATGIKDTLQQVKKVQQVINTFGMATKLGASIISKQPIAITASLLELLSSFGKLKADTKK